MKIWDLEQTNRSKARILLYEDFLERFSLLCHLIYVINRYWSPSSAYFVTLRYVIAISQLILVPIYNIFEIRLCYRCGHLICWKRPPKSFKIRKSLFFIKRFSSAFRHAPVPKCYLYDNLSKDALSRKALSCLLKWRSSLTKRRCLLHSAF